ncbi:MAG: hypothetical protein GYB68_00830 [Chloroflexi bacterium]|nr:hypothetical protein [Chloroflexota bacterium]
MVTPIDRQAGPTDHSLASELQKAKQYTEERERIDFTAFKASFRGDNNNHTVTYTDGVWDSDSDFFKQRGYSSHTIALERILEGMITPVKAD